MAISKDHEIHARRARSNVMLGLVLAGLVGLIFAITLTKMIGGASMVDMEASDHVLRPQLLKASE